MSDPILYSTNPYFAIEVAKRYRKNTFHAWVSDVFSSNQQSGHAPSSGIAASSDPMTIYHQLFKAVDTEDSHDTKIKSYKRTFSRLADIWHDDGSISKEDRDEIKGQCKIQTYKMWRPLLYVIPRSTIIPSERLTLVPPSKRAGSGREYIISDLKDHEFNIIELPRLN
ncbi:hypothetical protein [Methylobacterium indicum]|uniref:hypothetical protein n=1 Tax=Methylobacterium indicum TaxID=1775910 RepID=UPI001041E22A|nr:hypothetical protein [Methylobacterium indicum]